jgi:hypothetical protein
MGNVTHSVCEQDGRMLEHLEDWDRSDLKESGLGCNGS